MTGPVTVDAAQMAGTPQLVRVIDALGEMFADLVAGRTDSPARTVIEHGPQRVLLVSPRSGGGAGWAASRSPRSPPTTPGAACR